MKDYLRMFWGGFKITILTLLITSIFISLLFLMIINLSTTTIFIIFGIIIFISICFMVGAFLEY